MTRRQLIVAMWLVWAVECVLIAVLLVFGGPSVWAMPVVCLVGYEVKRRALDRMRRDELRVSA
jgi:hypothetical protein